MNIKNKALRVLGTVGAVLLSIPLVVMLITAPLYSATASLITPQSVTQIVRNVDFASTMAENDALQQAGDAEHLPSEMMGALVNSALVGDVLAAYTEEMTAVLRGEESTAALSKENLLALADKHMDELLKLANTYMPEAQDVTEDELRTFIREAVGATGEELLGTLPTGEEMQQMVDEGGIIDLVTALVSGGIPVLLYGLTLVLAGLIFVCLLHRFRGLLCLGIDALVALIPLLAAHLLLRQGGLLYNQVMLGNNPLLISAVDLLARNLLIAVIIMGLVGLTLIAGYTVYVNRLKKKDAGEAAPALPQE